MQSLDDQHHEWDFEFFNRVTSDMNPQTSSVGTIMAAMVYQIEQQNNPKPVASPTEDLVAQLDTMMTRLSFESAAAETDFKHQFTNEKVVNTSRLPNQTSSPYQAVFNESNQIGQQASDYKFLNGKDQGSYHVEQLQGIEMPCTNSRSKPEGHEAITK